MHNLLEDLARRLQAALSVALLALGVVAAAHLGMVQAILAQGSKPCATKLDACPARGCAKEGSGDAATNQVKRTRPTGQTAVRLTLDDFATLQDEAENLSGLPAALKKGNRSKLANLTLPQGQVSEGDLVQVAGYLVGKAHANKRESVNCRLKKQKNNDFHLSVARQATDTEFKGIVVEMIPQGRLKGWTTKKLNRIAKDRRQVLVRGQLFYDNKHVVNEDEDDPIGGQPKRFSLWEVHPVTEFHVCDKGQTCDPGNLSQWKPLETVK